MKSCWRGNWALRSFQEALQHKATTSPLEIKRGTDLVREVRGTYQINDEIDQ